ncbi:Aste57867_1582 [Aphanomyces stellatus]|uniref:Aste57867_1582 protein n=1 Tax=Aphanomyces stellatus TaxID=120398 RepID=A0A485K6S9_9STRA|nr:hypothetical protein As57867_001581 [Aphanomyces stellatus]VFT78795.1 Aste57867_1582 [Aphanomyces stellatus]
MQAALTRVCRVHRRHTAVLGQAAFLSTKSSTQIPPPGPTSGIFNTNFDVTQPKHQERMERWKWVLDLLGYYNEDARITSNSALLYNSCVNQAAHPSFFRALDLPADFRAQQALLMVHVWIVHRRLISKANAAAASGKADPGKVLQEALFDRLWEDTIFRIRHQNVSELTVNKHLGEVQQRCFGQCVAFDQHFNAGGSKTVLTDAISRHVLNVEPGVKAKQAALLSTYILRELKTVSKTRLDDLESGEIEWGAPLDAPHSTDAAAAADDNDFDLIGQQYGNWRSALDIRGKRYFWNMTTRVSAWDKPAKDAK